MTTLNILSSQKASNSNPVVYLYKLDFSTCNTSDGTVLYLSPFSGGTPDDPTDIVFDGQTYTRAELWLDGIGSELGGTLPKPRLRYNARDKDDQVFQYARGYNDADIRGMSVTRIKTYSNFLDGAADANPDMKSEIVVVINSVQRDRFNMTFDMSTNYGLEGINNKANRTLSMDSCALKYRIWNAATSSFVYTAPEDGGCPWGNPTAQVSPYDAVPNWGTLLFDSNDNVVTDQAQDRCSLHMTGCMARFCSVNAAQQIPIEATFSADTGSTGG